MSIKLVKEPDGAGPPYERCCFCWRKTTWWHAKKDVAVWRHERDGIATFAARAVLDLFAPILAEKERAELVLCDLMNAAGHYKATHSEIDREALSATIKAAADHFAAAIRAQGE